MFDKETFRDLIEMAWCLGHIDQREDAATLEVLPLEHDACPNDKKLATFQSLRLLTLADHRARHIEAFRALTSLETLCLKTGQIKDFTPLADLPHLRHLELELYRQPHLNHLSNTSIERLDLSHSKDYGLKTLEGMGALPALRDLDLRGSALRDLAQLPLLPMLEMLDLRESKIKYFSHLAIHPTLSEVIVDATHLKKAGPLAVTAPTRSEPLLYGGTTTRSPIMARLMAHHTLDALIGMNELRVLEAPPELLSDATVLAQLPITHLIVRGGSRALHDLNELPELPRLQHLTWIATPRYGADLAGIARFPALRSLHVTSLTSRDLEPLREARGLLRLSLGRCATPTLDALSECVSLRTLTLQGESGAGQHLDLSPLSAMRDLSILSITSAGISDLSPLSRCVYLSALTMTGNAITDLAPLQGLPMLHHVRT